MMSRNPVDGSDLGQDEEGAAGEGARAEHLGAGRATRYLGRHCLHVHRTGGSG